MRGEDVLLLVRDHEQVAGERRALRLQPGEAGHAGRRTSERVGRIDENGEVGERR